VGSIEPYRKAVVDWAEQRFGNKAMTDHAVLRMSLMATDRKVSGSADYRMMEIDVHAFETVPGSIMISTYLNTGYDGKGIDALIIPKIPYADLGDEVVSKRMKENPRWYAIVTSQNLIQALGRAVRKETDTCCHYVLDAQMVKFFGRYKDLFPRYLRDAMLWKRRV
jgi:hypothetical protein